MSLIDKIIAEVARRLPKPEPVDLAPLWSELAELGQRLGLLDGQTDVNTDGGSFMTATSAPSFKQATEKRLAAIEKRIKSFDEFEKRHGECSAHLGAKWDAILCEEVAQLKKALKTALAGLENAQGKRRTDEP